MLGPPKLRCLDQPIGHSIEQLVPQDHFYRHLDAKLDLSFVRAWTQDRYAEGGRPSIDPVVFFKLQLVMFFEGLRSERQLMRVVADRLSVRWYLGYAVDEALPDHSSLTRIRSRLGLPTFQRFFDHVVALCQQAGLVWGTELIFDATKVRANAALTSLVPRWYAEAKAHLDALFVGDAATDETAAPATPSQASAVMVTTEPTGDGFRPLPFAGPADAERALSAANQAVWRLLDRLRLDPGRPASCSYRRTTDSEVSTTDPDAAPMRAHVGDRTTLGYHDHYVVDGGKGRIILAAFVTPADVMENTPMLDLLHRVRFRWKARPKRVVGDTTYGTSENIHALEGLGIRAYVPLPNFDARTPYFGASHFHYDPTHDQYRCPQGHPLSRLKVKYTEEVVVYRAEGTTCNACPLKAQCTASDHGRTIQRSFYADAIDRVRGYHQTAAYAKAMAKRKVWVEPLFGEAKDWHGLRRFRLRGLWKVNCEGLLIAAGQNLKRWLSKTGWGRRHGPSGSLFASAAASSVHHTRPW